MRVRERWVRRLVDVPHPAPAASSRPFVCCPPVQDIRVVSLSSVPAHVLVASCFPVMHRSEYIKHYFGFKHAFCSSRARFSIFVLPWFALDSWLFAIDRISHKHRIYTTQSDNVPASLSFVNFCFSFWCSRSTRFISANCIAPHQQTALYVTPDATHELDVFCMHRAVLQPLHALHRFLRCICSESLL